MLAGEVKDFNVLGQNANDCLDKPGEPTALASIQIAQVMHSGII